MSVDWWGLNSIAIRCGLKKVISVRKTANVQQIQAFQQAKSSRILCGRTKPLEW